MINLRIITVTWNPEYPHPYNVVSRGKKKMFAGILAKPEKLT